MNFQPLSELHSGTFNREYLISEAHRPLLPLAILYEPASSWIIAPEAKAKIVLIYDHSDLDSVEGWQALRALVPLHRLEIAHYVSLHPNLNAGPALEACGLKNDYRNKGEWQECAGFSAATISLGVACDFSVPTLRLFERFTPEEKTAWSEIWKRRTIKRNLIKEIVHDFYDLTEIERSHCLKEAVSLEKNWSARSQPFPADELRNIVRRRRNPETEQAWMEIKKILQSAELPEKATLALPPDLEGPELFLKIQFKSADELSEILNGLARKQLDAIQKILDAL